MRLQMSDAVQMIGMASKMHAPVHHTDMADLRICPLVMQLHLLENCDCVCVTVETKYHDGERKQGPPVQPDELHTLPCAASSGLPRPHDADTVTQDHRRRVDEAKHGLGLFDMRG